MKNRTRSARIVLVHLRASLHAEWEYRANFAAQALDAFIGLAMAVGSISVVLGSTDRLGDWSVTDLMLLVAVYMLLSGFVNAVVHPSLSRFVREVADGSFDFVLLKPVDAQVLTGLREIQISKVVDMLIGGTVLCLLTIGGNGPGSLADAALMLIMIVAGACGLTAIWFIVATSVFWLIRIDNVLAVLHIAFQSGRWPADVYPRWLKWALPFVLPFTLATTIPAGVATGHVVFRDAIVALAFASALCVISRLIWKRGLARYSSASS